ncbi:TetR/AcrR family transcriptional regulator [Pseudomonas nicosulfuronedens]|uniref:TetR/AcrR family transcriptional regulator n=1 Tax=Pseudomonas nicosulfuronedens TaxID=2571105 RepID=A0A5R9QM37_9PSED|nr:MULTISPECIES: TetR/AcrR family transcriptional regulator [Pseudomonas]TLX70630.1 TetR/AcrR family transcriptional regulator [Pseudomonas nicosulfuronedens]
MKEHKNFRNAIHNMKRERTATTTPRGRPNRQQAEQRHVHLLTLAREHFLAEGFGAATIDRIAAASGVSKSTIYAHFGGKEGLFRAVTKRSCHAPGAALQQVRIDGRRPAEVIGEFIRVLIDEARDPDSLALLRLAIFESPRFPDVAQAIHQASLETLEPLRAYLSHLQQTGELGAGDMDLAAQDLASLCTGGYGFLLLNDRGGESEQEAARILGLFLRGMGLPE